MAKIEMSTLEDFLIAHIITKMVFKISQNGNDHARKPNQKKLAGDSLLE